MALRIITDANELRSLKHDWDALLANSYEDVLPLTHSWIVAWWESFGGAGCQLHVVIIQGPDGEMLAVAPFMRARRRLRRVTVNALSLMVNGHSAYSGIIVRRGVDITEVLRCVLDHLTGLRDVDLIELRKIAVDGQVCDAAVRYLRATGHLFGIDANVESPYIPTTKDWEIFTGSLSRGFRKHIRRRLRSVEASNGTAIDKTVVRDHTASVVADAVSISAASWKRECGTHIDGDPEGRKFLFALCDRFGEEEAVSIWRLKKDDRPIAFEFHVAYDGVIYPQRADYRTDFAQLYPGAVLECHILRSLFGDSSVREYNTSGDTYGYLMRWTSLTRKYADVRIFQKRPRPYSLYLFEYRLMPMVRWVRRLVRSLRKVLDRELRE